LDGHKEIGRDSCKEPATASKCDEDTFFSESPDDLRVLVIPYFCVVVKIIGKNADFKGHRDPVHLCRVHGKFRFGCNEISGRILKIK
jgi:hypothetical protein